jgi:hypothetical protein
MSLETEYLIKFGQSKRQRVSNSLLTLSEDTSSIGVLSRYTSLRFFIP